MLEKGTSILTLWFVVYTALQYLSLVMGTEGEPAVCSCRPGPKPLAELLLLLVFCLLVIIFPTLFLISSSHFLSGLSRRNIFMDQATTVDSLWNELDCWVYSEMPLSSSSEFPLKITPPWAQLLFLIFFTHCCLCCICDIWLQSTSTHLTPSMEEGKNTIIRVVQGTLRWVLGQVSQNGSSLAPYVPCSTSPCFTYTMLTWMCLPPSP